MFVHIRDPKADCFPLIKGFTEELVATHAEFFVASLMIPFHEIAPKKSSMSPRRFEKKIIDASLLAATISVIEKDHSSEGCIRTYVKFYKTLYKLASMYDLSCLTRETLCDAVMKKQKEYAEAIEIYETSESESQTL